MKKFSLIILVLFTFFSAAGLKAQDVAPFEPKTLVYKLEEADEAMYVADVFDLNLIQVSPRGVAVYETTEDSDLELLLSLGFAIDGLSKVARPPWQRTEDPYLDEQYALEMMDVFEAWDLTEGDSSVTVAIIDTGIDASHPEFSERLSSLSYNASTLEVGLEHVDDDYGHGTMVAGIVGALKDNGRGIAGLVQSVSLMVIKANIEGEEFFRDSALIEGIYYAVDNGADIINLSLGGSGISTQVKTALEYAYTHGVLSVAAAGNDGDDGLIYPAAYETTLSVSAVNEDGLLASFSNYGSTIDLSAPGEDIITTVINNGYVTASGTSFAAPQVSGVLALMLSYLGPMDREEAVFRLLSSTVDQGDPGWDIYYGHGIANAYNALTYEFVTVSFETYDGTNIAPIEVAANEPFSLPEDPILADHVFEGWFRDESFTIPWDETVDVATEDITLYARFNPSFHTVYFVTEGTPVDPIVVEHEATFDLPVSTLEDHYFEGWAIDEARTILYEPEPILSDLTLYAVFTSIVYYEVNLWLGGELYDTLYIEEDTYFTPETLEKIGYTFDGWYIDETLETLYEGSYINEAIDLYAQFIPNLHVVSFVTEGTEVDDYIVPYGETFTLPETSKDGYFFINWYLEPTYDTVYEVEPVTEDFTLYARFVEEAFIVTYYVDGDYYDEVLVAKGDLVNPLTPTMLGKDFNGWYLDESFDTAYIDEPVLASFDLYGYFTTAFYTVTFYDYDLTTIIHQEVIEAGTSIDPPEAPLQPDSLAFEYTFAHWSETTSNVYDDLDVYPIYTRTFKSESVYLNPGIDTIEQGTSWEDAGVSILEETLNLVVNGTPDTSQTGKYAVIYEIYDGDELVYQIARHVRVVTATPDIELTFNPGISTLPIGAIYHEPGAETNFGTIEIIADVDPLVPGRYPVIYRVAYNGYTFERTRYVHVLENTQSTASMIADVPSRRKELHNV